MRVRAFAGIAAAGLLVALALAAARPPGASSPQASPTPEPAVDTTVAAFIQTHAHTSQSPVRFAWLSSDVVGTAILPEGDRLPAAVLGGIGWPGFGPAARRPSCSAWEPRPTAGRRRRDIPRLRFERWRSLVRRARGGRDRRADPRRVELRWEPAGGHPRRTRGGRDDALQPGPASRCRWEDHAGRGALVLQARRHEPGASRGGPRNAVCRILEVRRQLHADHPAGPRGLCHGDR